MTWTLPQIELPAAQATSVDVSTLSDVLISTLRDLGCPCSLKRVLSGPSTISFELAPEHGVRMRDLTKMRRQDDLAFALGTESVRIQAPILGRSLIGIEIA